MTTLMSHAAWILIATFALSIIYELYRATLKAGTSKYDSMHVFVTQNIPFYILASVVIALLFTETEWAAWIGLIVSIVLILVSLFYNPRMMIKRKPGLIDWFEDIVYTGLLFVVAVLLLYAVLGKRLFYTKQCRLTPSSGSDYVLSEKMMARPLY